MAAVTIRNLPDDVHRALKLRAVQHNRSTEAKMRAILETAVRPAGRGGLGSCISNISRASGVTEDDAQAFIRSLEEERARSRLEPPGADLE